ncbi:hypothetical protein [Methylobacter tundripaludum]|uniref:Uncharacterized protein n=1 Tax=Methylobacter tundripaludum (strain ATCC BAA-1195 / DSM 17260 / SV96) TaxID=697282 RepID=G3IRB5_METTV|nr:hypothetical protein [Methylobacter tundripaludum]EGW22126.1 hypothetical protein Mettu_0927 [Methylobacter tundripaludum SV96]
MPTKRKGGIWYQRGFDSADRDNLVRGEETPKQKAASAGYKYGFPMHRFPLKENEFIRGYWDSIEVQQNKNALKMEVQNATRSTVSTGEILSGKENMR